MEASRLAQRRVPELRIRTLLFSTLFPSANRPTHGIFVEARLRELLRSGEVETRVVAPVPWFPSAHPRFGSWGQNAATPAVEVRNGIEVRYPRYLLPPMIGMSAAPWLLAWGARPAVAALLREGFDFDLIDAHYYYPDGVAASLLARWFDRPFVVTARGTDLNLIPRYAIPRALIRRAALRASASIGVCAALTDVLRDMGVPDSRLHVMRNGVDLQRFFPVPQQQARDALGVAGGLVLLSVGHLVERKGHHVAIDALTHLPEATLLVVGDGVERERLAGRARERGVADRVRFAGAVPNAGLSPWYSAADVLVLASSREGWANVLLEGMACGTPVVATRIWGTPEVVRDERVGELVADRSGEAFAQGVRRLLARQPQRAEVRRYAESFSWQDTSDAQLRLFREVIARERGSATPVPPG